jgi:hypothetical protein
MATTTLSPDTAKGLQMRLETSPVRLRAIDSDQFGRKLGNPV